VGKNIIRLQFGFSKRAIFEILILVAILVVGVWYVFWGSTGKDASPFLCETCPVTECNISLIQTQEYPSPVIRVDDRKDGERYQIGDIFVDNNGVIIKFPGSIGDEAALSVQFLVSPQLPGVSIKSFITAEAKPVDLQNAIALVDWHYLEQLRTTNDVPLELLIQWDEDNSTKQAKATEVVEKHEPALGELIFLGTEFQWQEIATVQSELPVACPLSFSPGELPPTLYEVRRGVLPASGTEVTLILRASEQ
jgi:hypothetical protein